MERLKSLKVAGQTLRNKVVEVGGARFAAEADMEFREGRLNDMARIYLDKVNFSPNLVGKERPNFLENRRRLNTEAGLIIANHPIKSDPWLVLSQIERKDILVMAEAPIYKALVRQLGPEIAAEQFIPHDTALSKVKAAMARINDHIAKGGAFLVFPSGRDDEGGEFKSSFRQLLQEIPKENMVYSFHIDEDDAQRAEKNTLTFIESQAQSQVLPKSVKNLRQLASPSVIDMDERYSTVAEWLNVIEGVPTEGRSRRDINHEANTALTEHFYTQFIEQLTPEVYDKATKDSFFTAITKKTLSGKSQEQLDQLHSPDLSYPTEEFERMSGPLEKTFGTEVKEAIRKGKDNPNWYEKCTPHFEHCSDEPILNLMFTGLADPDTVDIPPGQAESWQEIFAKESLSEKAISAGMKTFRGPQPSDINPNRGLVCVFHGSAGRASHSKEQFVRVSEMMRKHITGVVRDFMELHPDNAQIRVTGVSAGTWDATLAMRIIGDLLGREVECSLIFPGTSLPLGIFAAWPASPAAESLREAGYTPQSFHEAVYEHTQEAQIKEGRYLPRGRDLRIFYGTHDTVIPASQPGGTLDFIKMARERGLAPAVFEYKGLDHITTLGEMMMQKAYGNDPLYERNRPSIWSIPESYSDPICIQELNKIMSRFSAEELPFFAEAMSSRNGTTMLEDMEPHMRAIAEWLLKNDLCFKAVGPRYLWVRNADLLIGKADPQNKREFERKVARELPRVIREVKSVDHDINFKPLYETTPEERMPRLVA